MMPESDDPVLVRGGKIGFQPGKHRTADRVVGEKGIQAGEVHIAVVEGIVELGPRSDTPGLAFGRECETIEIRSRIASRTRVFSIMISQTGPNYGPSQQTTVHVEDSL